MIKRYSTQSTLPFILKATNSYLRTWKAYAYKGQSESLLQFLEKNDPENAAIHRQKYLQAQSVIKRLETSKTQRVKQRRDAAREKIKRLEAKIQALLLMGSLNPKTIARKIARLARELSSAASEYASAGGNTHSATTSSAAMAVTAQSAQDMTSIQPGAGLPYQDENHRIALYKMVDEHAETIQKRAAAQHENDDFKQLVRRLMWQLKSIIKKEKLTRSREDKQHFDQDLEQAHKAMQDTQKSLDAISATSVSVSVSVNLDV